MTDKKLSDLKIKYSIPWKSLKIEDYFKLLLYYLGILSLCLRFIKNQAKICIN
jgi:hypothetical protein